MNYQPAAIPRAGVKYIKSNTNTNVQFEIFFKYKYKQKYTVFVFEFVFANTNTYLTPALSFHLMNVLKFYILYIYILHIVMAILAEKCHWGVSF